MKHIVKRFFTLYALFAVGALPALAPAGHAHEGHGEPASHAHGEVNVYSYRQSFLIEPLFDTFTNDTGIRVNTVFAKQGLIERLRQEGDNSPADLLMTVDISRLSEAAESGLTQAAQSEVLERNIPAEFRDPEHHWFGLTTRGRIIVAARERVAPGEISRYEELALPRWRGRVCTRSGKHIYMVALTASMIAHHGREQAGRWLAGLKTNLARKPQGNDRAQVKAIKEGVCDVTVINTYYMGRMLADPEQAQWADSVFMIFPNQDDRGAHVNVSGMALSRSAPNRDKALRLMEFLSGNKAQQLYAERNFEYPVKSGLPLAGLVASWGEFKADKLALERIARLRGEASRLADEVGYDE